jgi:4-amino-4-deoxy-L-arabinose transferase-like glycosyltransferase
LPWIIAGSCWLFGDKEWAVRLPMLVSFVAAAWGVGKLAISITGNQRAGLLAILCFLLMPAFQANGQISTQDGPLIAIWVALTAIGLRLFRRWRSGESTWMDWLLMWTVLGIGFLFKQSILVFLPSIALFALLQLKRLKWNIPVLIAQQFAGIAIFIALISPMLIWNARHDWVTFAHTAGHLGAGGDQAGQVNRGNALQWFGNAFGGFVAAFGPAAVALMAWASIWAWKRRDDGPDHCADRIWLIAATWPAVLFFLGLSFIKPVVPSWPLPHAVPMMALLGEFVVYELHQNQKLFRLTWNTVIAYGLGGWIVVSFLPDFVHLPVFGKLIERPVALVTGHRADAELLQSVLADLKQRGEPAPLIVARHYMRAGLLSFYSPSHPTVYTAGKYLGKRSTTFDQWDDTRLDNPALYGRSLLLCGNGDGNNDVPWSAALIFDSPESLANNQFTLVRNYQGPRPDHPRALPGSD